MNANSFGLDFIIRKHRIEKDYVVIFVRITVNSGEPSEIGLKEKVLRSLWDPKGECVKGKSDVAKQINNFIENVRNNIGTATGN